MPHLPQNCVNAQDPSQRPGNIPHAVFLMSSAAILIAASSAILKAFSSGIPAMECAFFRSIVGVIFIAALALFRIKPMSVGRNKKLLFLRGLFGGLASMAYVWAIPRMDLGLANGLNQTSPIFVCLFAAIFLGERFHWTVYLTVVLSFCGIALVLKPDVTGWNLASILALSSGIISGLAYTCIKKLRQTESTETIVMWFMAMTCILSALTIPIQPWHVPPWPQFIGLVLVGLTTLASQILMTMAYKYAPATIVAPFIYLSTFSSLIMAYVLWDELPGTIALVGCGIVVVCAIGIGILPSKLKPGH